MRVVSFFAGCGGLDLGFEQAGFDVVWANESIPDLSAIEAELQSHAPDSFLLVLPKKICHNRYSQWCDLLFKTLRHPSITLRYGVSSKVLGESIYDKSFGKIYILGIKNASNTKVWMKFNEIVNNEYCKTA